MTGEVTQLLRDWGAGDQSALDRLMPLVYDELRRLARAYMRNERNQPSIQPTALVHKAYIRLTDHPQMSWENRAQFFWLAARLMGNILVDHARAWNCVSSAGCRFLKQRKRWDSRTRSLNGVGVSAAPGCATN